jgi:hypothetical protein
MIALSNLHTGEQERSPVSMENTELFVFVALINGARFTQPELFCAWLDIRIPSKTALSMASKRTPGREI